MLRIKNLTFAYPGRPALWQELNLSLSSGQRVGIIGPNGSGKSTLFNLMLGLIRPQAGEIYLNGKLCQSEAQFAGQRTTFGYAFQDPDDQLFCPTLYEDVAFGPRNQGHDKLAVDLLTRQALELFGLMGLAQQPAYHLSGGEKKLASLACVWSLQPQALLLDEPTLSLDEGHQARLEQILADTLLPWIMVSHDTIFLAKVCNEIWQVGGRQLHPAA